MCALWFNEDADLSEFKLDGYDIDEQKQRLKGAVKLPVKRIYSGYSEVYFDKRKPNYLKTGGIVVGLDGLESKLKTRVCPIDDPNVLCYLDVHSSGFDNPDLNCSMVITSSYRGNGFFVRKDNFLEKLPMFAAGRYITYNREWTERARIMKSADGAKKFFRDVKSGKLEQFLLKCLLFTCIEMQNHCRTFKGSDNHFYKNELCLDSTNGETVALERLKKLNKNNTENLIFSTWEKLMGHVKNADEYNPKLTYGIYQIYDEIDTSYKDENDAIVYNNPEVHTDLDSMKNLCKSYYNTEIVPTLFKYEFLK